jgi:hypothetical protein
VKYAILDENITNTGRNRVVRDRKVRKPFSIENDERGGKSVTTTFERKIRQKHALNLEGVEKKHESHTHRPPPWSFSRAQSPVKELLNIGNLPRTVYSGRKRKRRENDKFH